MTRIAPSDPKPLDLDARKSMTKARRARILAAYNGHCAYLGCEATEGLEIDHFIPLAIGGRDDDGNLRPLCRSHHAVKTKLDVRLIAKAKRINRKSGEPKPPGKIKSRPFDRGLRKRMNGTVERRDEP
jgi:5-methylcytosine-specific restriction enzyme A